MDCFNSHAGITEGAVLHKTASTEGLEKLFEGDDLVGEEDINHLLQSDRKETDVILNEILPSIQRHCFAWILQAAHSDCYLVLYQSCPYQVKDAPDVPSGLTMRHKS